MSTRANVETGVDETTSAQDGFKKQLPDNCVEYLLFILNTRLDARNQLTQIETIRKSALKLANDLTKDYIWQKDEFNLDLKNEQGELLSPSTSSSPTTHLS